MTEPNKSVDLDGDVARRVMRIIPNRSLFLARGDG